MASQLKVTTTGTLSPVVLTDLGRRSLPHPTTSLDLALEYTFDELRRSASLQTAITAGHLTAVDENSTPITSVANQLDTVPQVEFDDHSARHQPGGADALTTATPVEITDTTNGTGTGTAFVRDDHAHAHGNRGGGTLHAAATISVAGFMSSADKTKLDNLGAEITAIKAVCRLSTLADDTLSGLAVRDGVTPSAGDRVLVKAQTAPAANGIYAAAAGAWARATDIDVSSEIKSGMLVVVSEGTANANTEWLLETDDPITIGTTGLAFRRVDRDKEVATVAALALLDAGVPGSAGGLPDGSTVWVSSRRRPYVLLKSSSLAASEDVVVGVNGVRWLDSGLSHWSWGFQHVWNVNPTLGSNDNAGTGTGASALKSAREYYKRTHGVLRQADVTDPSNTFTVEVSLPSDDPVVIGDLCHDQGIAVFDRINCTRTVVASGTLTAATNHSHSAGSGGQQAIITDTGLGGGFGPHVGRYIRIKTSLGVFKASAFIVETSGPNGALIGIPMNNDAPMAGNAGEVLTLAVGDTYDIFTIAAIPGLYVTQPGHLVDLDRPYFFNSLGYTQIEIEPTTSLSFWGANFDSILYGESFEDCNFQNCRWNTGGGIFLNDCFINGGVADNLGGPSTVTLAGKAYARRWTLFNHVGVSYIDTVNTQAQDQQIAVRGCAAAQPAIQVTGRSNLLFSKIIGDSNLGKGLVFGSLARDCTVELTIGFNLTAGAGLNQVEFTGGAVALFTDVDSTDLRDENGNWLIGARKRNVSQVDELTNQAGATLAPGILVRQNGTSGQVTRAQADTVANASGVVGVVLNSAANTTRALVARAGHLWVQFTSAPTAGAMAYLSEGTAGQATTTVPPVSGTNQKLPLGPVVEVSGTMGKVAFNPAQYPVLSNGLDSDPVLSHGTRHNPGGADPITTAAAIALNADSANAEGGAGSVARSDHSHDIDTAGGTISTVQAGDAAAEGAGTGLARRDHQHAVETAAAVALNADSTNTEGAGTSLARATHTHDIDTAGGTISTVQAGDAAAEGAGTGLARRDHQHAVETGAAVGLNADSTNTEGAGTALARAAHTHDIDTAGGTISTIQAGDGAAEGAGTGLSRRDHQHAVETAVAVTLSGTNKEGISTSLARADHEHALADALVTYAKIQDVSAASRLLGRGSAAGAGDVEEITLGTNLSMAGTVLNATGGGGGSVDWKDSVRLASVTGGNVDVGVGGLVTVDSVTTVAGDRVLLKNQTAPAENGIWVAAAGAWSRATDADASAEVTAGLTVYVGEGTTNADTYWALTTNDPITLGTTGLTFEALGLLATTAPLDVDAGAAAVGTSLRAAHADHKHDIAANAIGNAELRDSAGTSVIGKFDAGTGDPADIVAGLDNRVLARTGGTLAFQVVTGTMLATNTVGNTQLRQGGALTVVGRSANSVGDLADIAATAASDQVLRESGSVLGFGTVATAGIADNAITNGKLRDSAGISVIGKATTGSGDPADIVATGGDLVLKTNAAGTVISWRAIEFSKGGTVLNPTVVNVIAWRAPFACTVTNVRGYRVAGTGATINARRNGTDNHLASALSLTSADTWQDGGAVQNAAYAAGDKLEIMVVSVAGTPTQIAVQVDFTRP